MRWAQIKNDKGINYDYYRIYWYKVSWTFAFTELCIPKMLSFYNKSK
jgi:hypothetical protein